LNPLENPVQIWVAATAANNPYRPHMCSEYHAMLSPEPPAEPINPCAWGQQNPTGNSCDECAGWSFHLQNHVEIYGGFPPDSATNEERDERPNWERTSPSSPATADNSP
jgi:hypothetical protein